MKSFRITIQGTTPLLCNKFTDAKAVGNGSSSAMVGDKGTPREQAEKKLYSDDKGKLYIPQPNLFRCIIDAGKFHKSGKSKITTQKTSLIPACVEIEGIAIPLVSKEGWAPDSRAVVIPATGGRIMAHRPMFNDWELTFVINVDDQMLDPKLLRVLVDDAGKKIGLGDFRPDRKGPFGKFVVTSWEEEKQKKAA